MIAIPNRSLSSFFSLLEIILLETNFSERCALGICSHDDRGDWIDVQFDGHKYRFIWKKVIFYPRFKNLQSVFLVFLILRNKKILYVHHHNQDTLNMQIRLDKFFYKSILYHTTMMIPQRKRISLKNLSKTDVFDSKDRMNWEKGS